MAGNRRVRRVAAVSISRLGFPRHSTETSMKKLLITGITAISFLFTSFSQPPYECYFPFEEGISFQRTYYDATGQITAISNAGIDSIAKMGHFYRAFIRDTMLDDKNKEIGRRIFTVDCTDDVIHLSANQLLNPCMTEAYQSMDMAISGEGIRIPHRLVAGSELPKGGNRIDVTSEGLEIVTLNFEIVDRKVEAREHITTPAGKFECFRIRETVQFQTMFLTRTYTTLGWYAKKVGLVRQETYDQKGVLRSRMELTVLGMGR